jgi:serine/threonine-protein kinase
MAGLCSPPAVTKTVGRYRLIRRIGRGGMGEVFLAQFEAVPGVRKLAAIKMLHEVADDVGGATALMKEARLTALLSHPNIVQMLDAGIDDGGAWLAMEFVPGLSLQDLIGASVRTETPLPPWLCARIVADACAGLHAVHEAIDERGNPLSIVHRDVTPHNLLVTWDGVVKVADFGIARSSLQSTVTRTGTVKGKLAFMAPEQATGGRVDRRTDVFALGVVLWETLARARLFKGASESETLARVIRCEVPSLRELAPHVHPALAQVAHRALEADPTARHATALEMGRAIESAMRAASVELGPPEVAAVIATLVPERVREHESWLREAEAAAASEPTQLTVTSTRSSRMRSTYGLVAMATVAAAAAGGAALALRSPAGPEPVAPSAAASPVRAAGAHSAQPANVAAPARLPSAVAGETVSPKPPPAASAIAARPAPPATAFGKLNVASRPIWSMIKVDGRQVGPTPIAGLSVAEGSHTVTAVPEGKGPAQRQAASVRAGKTTSLQFDFGKRKR